MSKIKKAVVIDDESIYRRQLSDILKKQGFNVETSTRPYYTSRYLQEQCICPETKDCTDFLIVDMHMPNMNGIEFAIRQKLYGCRIKNIAFMSKVWKDFEIEIIRKLNFQIFNKPIVENEIIEWLKNGRKGNKLKQFEIC